jgi:hypothetical protein
MKDTDRVIMVKSDGRFVIVDRYKIKTVSGGPKPMRSASRRGAIIEPAARRSHRRRGCRGTSATIVPCSSPATATPV